MKKYIAKSIRTWEWLTSDNLLYDRKSNEYYLIPDLFSKDDLPLDKKSLAEYRVYPKSIGWAVSKDIKGKTIYAGDTVEIDYYNKDEATFNGRNTVRAIVCYDKNLKIHYMLSGKKIFMFNGDGKHFISQIRRVSRFESTEFITEKEVPNDTV